ncbi:MAG: ATP-binding cassette domain-containing protein [Deltaproteobacteria bacterium]|nr:ATP-binding cassette domain-containing protein [Deltaproteobacteria bacterium]
MSPVVELCALSKSFPKTSRAPGIWGQVRSWIKPERGTVDAVIGASFSIEEGEAVALIGPNGAGKSTTLKMLTGILVPSAGEVRVLGLVPWRERTRLALNIATVFGQRSQLWYHLPAAETFELLSRIYEIPRPEYLARKAELSRRFELGPLLGTPVRKLSLGERMRCEIAASLLHRPRVLFLDEPTIGLDVIAKQQIREVVRALNQKEGVTVLLTSHDAGDIEVLARRVLVINHGRLMLNDTVATMKARFLRKKLVRLSFASSAEGVVLPEFPGVTELQRSPLSLQLVVDSKACPIERVLSACLSAAPVADVTVEDPPMEEIIAEMYRAQRNEGRPAP